MSVAINDIPSRKEELTDIEKEIRELYRSGTRGQSCMIAVGDVSSEEDVKRMIEEVVAQLGGLDVVGSRLFRSMKLPALICSPTAIFDEQMVANAGIFPPVKTFIDSRDNATFPFDQCSLSEIVVSAPVETFDRIMSVNARGIFLCEYTHAESPAI